ncbi:hypothetical protein [Klebsiella phage 05F01]|nr:hypothetical protein [Klebsiella phage 05F01]
MKLKCIESNVSWFIKDKLYEYYESIDGEFIYCEDGVTWWLSDDRTYLVGLDDAFFENDV